jgi:hypothetical protein
MKQGFLLGCLLALLLAGGNLALADDLPALNRNLPGIAPMAQPLPGYMQNMLWMPQNVGNLQQYGQILRPPVGAAGTAFGYVEGYGYTVPMYGASYGCAGYGHGYGYGYGHGYRGPVYGVAVVAGDEGAVVVVGSGRHTRRQIRQEARQLRRAYRGYPVATPY